MVLAPRWDPAADHQVTPAAEEIHHSSGYPDHQRNSPVPCDLGRETATAVHRVVVDSHSEFRIHLTDGRGNSEPDSRDEILFPEIEGTDALVRKTHLSLGP